MHLLQLWLWGAAVDVVIIHGSASIAYTSYESGLPFGVSIDVIIEHGALQPQWLFSAGNHHLD